MVVSEQAMPAAVVAPPYCQQPLFGSVVQLLVEEDLGVFRVKKMDCNLRRSVGAYPSESSRSRCGCVCM
jgi:hypothetical protein